eukprot:TRINITY_DN6947_c0_g1_i1.p1 TRINITY_DN6947_c0_g1~~TRINITY_DN6947_c0_g1_i1.p1  ORF type:complete len:544 (+),score=96.23 TRINITY_DN6947_c0_g1_i1:170-1801(+)
MDDLAVLPGLVDVPSRLGNYNCWLGELRFTTCCSVRVFGPEGNEDCWARLPGATFQRCCLDAPMSEEEFEHHKEDTLARAKADFKAAAVEMASLIHRFDLERTVLGVRPLRTGEAELLSGMNSLMQQWRAEQLAGLAAKLPEVLESYAAALRNARRGRRRDRGQGLRIGILTGCTADSASSDVCQAGPNLWECYANRHGYDFIYDANKYPSYPQRFRFKRLVEEGVAAALDATFDAAAVEFLYQEPASLLSGTDGVNFKWWQRWYAARRHLLSYDLLLVVDPDTAVFPTCMGEDLLSLLGLGDDMEDWPGVIARDPRQGEDLNGGVFALTGTPWGLLYLELLLARSRWPVDVAGGGGWCQARQGAEYETFLEVAALSAGGPLDYTSECMQHALPQSLSDGTAYFAGCLWPQYSQCWQKNLARLLGPHGRRKTARAKLIDPRHADINYRPWSNEARYRDSARRTGALPPISNAAFLWHYVGVPKKVQSMLRDFGLSRLNDTFDCEAVNEFADDTSNGLPPCKKGGSEAACPFEDALLMPRQFGC